MKGEEGWVTCKHLKPRDIHTVMTSFMLTQPRDAVQKILSPHHCVRSHSSFTGFPGKWLSTRCFAACSRWWRAACWNVLCQNPKSQSLQIPVLSFPIIIWHFSQQRGLLGVLLKRPFFPATKQLWRNKGPEPVRTHMKLAKYRSRTAVRSAFCGARSQHLARTAWLRQRNSIWLSNHQSTTAWPREWIQLDNTVETWLLGLVAKSYVPLVQAKWSAKRLCVWVGFSIHDLSKLFLKLSMY